MTDQLQDLALNLVTTGFVSGAREVAALNAQLAQMRMAVAGTATATTKQTKIYGHSGKVISSVAKKTDQAAAKTKALGKQIDQTNKGFLGLSDTLDKTVRKVALWTLSTTIIFGTLRAFKAAGAVITQHDTDMVGLRKVYSGAEEDLKGIEDAVLATAKAMKSLNADAFDAAVTVARTGRIGVDLTRLTTAALVAQNIAELETADAVLFLNSALIQFNQETDQALRVLDEWNELSNRTPATTMDLAKAVSVAGSVFKQAGSSIQFLNANTAALVEITAKSGNIIGRAERTMAIFSQRQSTVNLLARVGIDVFDRQTKQFIGIDKLLTTLASKWGNMNDQWRTTIAQAVAGARQQQFFIALMENQDLVLRNLSIQWESYGSAIEENEKFLLSISKRVDGLINALERLAISIGDAGATATIKVMIDALTGMVNAMSEANIAMNSLALGLGVLAARFALLHASMGVFGAMSLALGTFITVLWQLNMVFDTGAKKQREYNEQLGVFNTHIQSLSAKTSALEEMVQALENLNEVGEDAAVVEMLEDIDRITQKLFGRDVLTNVSDYDQAMGDLKGTLKEIRDEMFDTRIASLKLQQEVLRSGLPKKGKSVTEISLGQIRGVFGGYLPAPKDGFVGPLTPAQQAMQEAIDDYQVIIDKLEALKRGEGDGDVPPVIPDEVDLNKTLVSLEAQQKLLEMRLAGKAEETILNEHLRMLQERYLEGAMSDVDLQRLMVQILGVQIKQREILLRKAQDIANVFERPLSQLIAAGFKGTEVDRAMHNFVTNFGDLLSQRLTDSIERSMIAKGATDLVIGLATGGVAGVVAGIFGLAANALFGDRPEDERQTDALEDNTIQLRALTETIADFSSFFVNAPAGFAIPAGATSSVGGGAAVVAGGGLAPGNTFNDNRSISLGKGAIQVTQLPGQDGRDMAMQIESDLADRWGHGSQTPQTF